MNEANADACRVALATGLRIGDVLKLRFCDINGNLLTFNAEKTHKNGQIEIDERTRILLKKHGKAGNAYCFAGSKAGKHRTRQAVWADMKRACKLLNIPLQISPHSCRKTYAVEVFHKEGLEAVRDKLQHDNVSTTLLYAFSDCNMTNPDERTRDIAREVAAEVFEEMKGAILNEIRAIFGMRESGRE